MSGVTVGEELSLALTNLPATYDLELFGPSQDSCRAPRARTQERRHLAVGHPGHDTEATPGSQDLAVTPPAGYQLEAVSNNPDGQSQYIQTPPLAAGNYIVQVSGYNGAFSSQPYLLQANLLGGETAPTCPGGSPTRTRCLMRALGPATPPSDLEPSAGERDPRQREHAVPRRTLSGCRPPSAGLRRRQPDHDDRRRPEQRSPADSAAGVTAPSSPSTPTRAVQIRLRGLERGPVLGRRRQRRRAGHLGRRRPASRPANPPIQNVVIVGADDQIPFARIADGATAVQRTRLRRGHLRR